MIASKDIHPERDVYYLGAKVIDILFDDKYSDGNYLDVFEELNFSENVSINLFTLVLDWLYLSGVVSGIENGRIIRCS